MKLLYSILLCLSLVGCGPFHKSRKVDNPPLMDQIEVKRGQLLNQLDVNSGWIDKEDCDGLLWNAMARLSDARIDLPRAMYPEEGKWQRRPDETCYDPALEKNGSASTISNDMLTGLFYALYATENEALLNVTYRYGKDNDWIMGDGVYSRTILRPNGIYLLTRAIEKLTGVRKPELDNPLIVNPYFPVSKDFERHIQTVGMLLTIELEGGATDQMKDRMKENIKYDKNDALFLAALSRLQPELAQAAYDLVSSTSYEAPSYVRGNASHFVIHKLFVLYTLERAIR